MVQCILLKHGYKVDLREEATKTVLEQAELLCADWTVWCDNLETNKYKKVLPTVLCFLSEVQSMVSDYFPKSVAKYLEFPQNALKRPKGSGFLDC